MQIGCKRMIVLRSPIKEYERGMLSNRQGCQTWDWRKLVEFLQSEKCNRKMNRSMAKKGRRKVVMSHKEDQVGISTLVLHPKDVRTDCLKAIYAGLPSVTLVTGGISRGKLHELIETHDRVFLIGLGDPWGLFSNGRFSNGFWVVGDAYAEVLKRKNGTGSLCVWPDADKYVRRHGLEMFATGYLPLADTEWDESDVERFMETAKSIRSLLADGIVQAGPERKGYSMKKAYRCLPTHSEKETRHRIEKLENPIGMRA
jgi:hypothetical protein